MNKEISQFNNALEESEKLICNVLAEKIQIALPSTESKIWHGAPVWFLNGNPIVGYDRLKDCVRLLFWSGQSFGEDGLTASGSFKAAEVRYTNANQVTVEELLRWLEKSKTIQWDYKNIVKRRGELEKLDT